MMYRVSRDDRVFATDIVSVGGRGWVRIGLEGWIFGLVSWLVELSFEDCDFVGILVKIVFCKMYLQIFWKIGPISNYCFLRFWDSGFFT